MGKVVFIYLAFFIFLIFSFFPRRTQRFANIIGNIMFRILASFKIFKKFKHLDSIQFETTLESFDNRDSERKKSIFF